MVGNETTVANFYNVTNGKIVRSFGKKEPEGIETKSRVNKNGDTVYELNYDYISGVIKNAEIKNHEEYGDNIVLTLVNGNDSAQLSIKFDSAYGRSFLFKLGGIDLLDEIKIKPYSFLNNEGKNIIGLNLFQDGKKIKNLYTREAPNGLPPLEEVTFNGKKQWDKTKQINFLKEKFNEFIDPFLKTDELKTPNNLSDDVTATLDELPF